MQHKWEVSDTYVLHLNSDVNYPTRETEHDLMISYMYTPIMHKIKSAMFFHIKSVCQSEQVSVTVLVVPGPKKKSFNFRYPWLLTNNKKISVEKIQKVSPNS